MEPTRGARAEEKVLLNSVWRVNFYQDSINMDTSTWPRHQQNVKNEEEETKRGRWKKEIKDITQKKITQGSKRERVEWSNTKGRDSR